MAKVSEAQKRAQAKYDKAHRGDYSNFYVKCHKVNDKDLIDFLQTKKNRTAYIKDLIRKDMTSGN